MSIQFDFLSSIISFWSATMNEQGLHLEAYKTISDYLPKLYNQRDVVYEKYNGLLDTDRKISDLYHAVASLEIEQFYPVNVSMTLKELTEEYNYAESKLLENGNIFVAYHNTLEHATGIVTSQYGYGLREDLNTFSQSVRDKISKIKLYLKN
ncbi:unnamed protein product [Cunninghamella blakesleeana]